MKWFKRARAKDATFDSMADTGEARFAPLDAMLAQALLHTLPNDLGQKLRRKEDLAWGNDTTITGLQVAWMI